MREGRYIISQDIANDPQMAPWRDQALLRGYRSSVAVPIRQNNRIIGALTVYAGEPLGFDPKDQTLLAEIGQAISFALDNLQAEKERKRAEAQLNEQIGELRRWHTATLGREGRILDLKHEVNELLAQTGLPPRYSSTAEENGC